MVPTNKGERKYSNMGHIRNRSKAKKKESAGSEKLESHANVLPEMRGCSKLHSSNGWKLTHE